MGRLVGLATRRLLGTGTIRHGVGGGLRFDATGGYLGYLLGTSEPEEQAFIGEHLAPGGVFYDVGANIGFFSTLAARLVGETGSVYAFEPHPTSCAAAQRNAELNGFATVTVVPAAVSNVEGPMTLSLADISARHHLGTEAGIEVDVVTLDHWRRRASAPPPTLVMIDVEGSELAVLDGMREILAAHQPVVCCEVHWLGDAFLDYFRRELTTLGYTLRNLHGGPVPSSGRWHAVIAKPPD
jgi:FkbM family methyltransferase